ncbi:MAG: ATP-binding cassette domain-containing protein [Magnetovibrio sp.]|nr:ATP-binding cassette domain-containing protein [Magnetovibrio sp.]
MTELIKRLKAYPLVTLELLGASLFANLLALASSLFVIQVLNRYVAHGINASLATMVVGVLIAIGFEVAFRQIRLTLADALSKPFDRAYAARAYDVLICAKGDALGQLTAGQKREAVAAPDAIQQAYSAPNMVAYLDVPFALIFLAALFLLSPLLALVALVFCSGVLLFGLANYRAMKKPALAMQGHFSARQSLLDSALSDPDTVRAFTARKVLLKRWTLVLDLMEAVRTEISKRQGGQQNMIGGIQALLSTAIIAGGAMLVVMGQLDVGLLIGANILAARTLGPIIRLAQSAGAIAKATSAIQIVENFTRLPLEPEDGVALGLYKGALELKDVGFAYPGQPTPLFESLNLKIEPGALFVVTGANSMGKTTFARMLVGLLKPSRGQVLVDGVDLAQVAPQWWRRQVIYLPQEPGFFNGTVRDNILAFNPQLDEAGLNRVIREAGLESYFAQSQKGFNTLLVAGGRDLSLGIRRRLALARALATDGQLVILDEPTEGLDAEGAQQISKIMNALSQRGCTIIALSHDPNIVQGAPHVLDLNVKPIPRILAAVDRASPHQENKGGGQ